MSKKDMKINDNKRTSSEKETNLNSNTKIKNFQDSPDSDDNEKDKPIHFKIEYDQNKKNENQIESSPEKNDNKNLSQTNKREQEFIIEKNNQTNKNINNPNYFQEKTNVNNIENSDKKQYYNLLKDNQNNDNENDKDDNFNNYYYHYLNNFNNNKNTKNFDEDDEEVEPKKIISFATQTYQGRIDPVMLNQKYNNFWKNQNKSKQKYKQKMDALKKVFNPYGYVGYNTVIKNNKKRRMSQSRYTTTITLNNFEKPPFDNTKQPLPKQSYLIVPYDYGINDPNYGKEDPANYDRKKMVKLRMIKQPLKYYYPYTNDFVKNKKLLKYE
jgi:hypothetical protein